ncbi:hypothetical protein M426DRAFT_316250 [Hypoxylon sp. CI-4A]|nr:hypothetical protein M426DRAFT_316250 [Hypoxylon sp. CI-4A]
MAPPPATPTPHRFLVPKRSQPRSETPKAFQTGGQQFQATPRFSLHSTPRGPPGGAAGPSSSLAAATTPAPTRTGAGTFYRPTPRNTDPINDVISSSPPFTGQQHNDNQDSFDVDTDVDAVPESSPAREPSDDHSEEDPGHRSPKRRRISISSSFSTDAHTSPKFEDESTQEDLVYRDHDDPMAIESSLPDYYHEPAIIKEEEEDPEAETERALLKSTGLSAHQPTFQKAPRFKPVEIPEGEHRGDPLPDVFSPHRRGAKYVPGGLAAEVRDWFVDVWASATTATTTTTTSIGATRRDDWIARILVEQVQAAPGMVLVTGRHVRGSEVEADPDLGVKDEDSGAAPGKADQTSTAQRSSRVVLAGSPRMVGLERSPEVRVGSLVGVGRPTWEMSLPDQGRWAVVCEWAVLR